jgi:hypothetical protein
VIVLFTTRFAPKRLHNLVSILAATRQSAMAAFAKSWRRE